MNLLAENWIKKPRNISIINDTDGWSRKWCKKLKKDRPSPSESATLFKEGAKKKGNDGNLYQISLNKNGVKRWTKLSNKKNSSKTKRKTKKTKRRTKKTKRRTKKTKRRTRKTKRRTKKIKRRTKKR